MSTFPNAALFLLGTLFLTACTSTHHSPSLPKNQESEVTEREAYRDFVKKSVLFFAERGDSAAQNKLGEMYHLGPEGTRDYAEAHKWYLKAVAGGNAEAANHLGRLYLNGEGVPKDPRAALAWYKKGAELGDKASEYNYYRTAYNNPEIISPDRTDVDMARKSISFFKSRAKKGDHKAQNAIGEIYHFGPEGIRDYAKAREWYIKAVKNGSGTAANHLGRLYNNGEGVSEDRKAALAWYKKGGELGDKQAEDNYYILKVFLVSQ